MTRLVTAMEFWLDLGDLGSCLAFVDGQVTRTISGTLSAKTTAIRARIPLVTGQEFFANVRVTDSTLEALEHALVMSAFSGQEDWSGDDAS